MQNQKPTTDLDGQPLPSLADTLPASFQSHQQLRQSFDKPQIEFLTRSPFALTCIQRGVFKGPQELIAYLEEGNLVSMSMSAELIETFRALEEAENTTKSAYSNDELKTILLAVSQRLITAKDIKNPGQPIAIDLTKLESVLERSVSKITNIATADRIVDLVTEHKLELKEQHLLKLTRSALSTNCNYYIMSRLLTEQNTQYLSTFELNTVKHALEARLNDQPSEQGQQTLQQIKSLLRARKINNAKLKVLSLFTEPDTEFALYNLIMNGNLPIDGNPEFKQRLEAYLNELTPNNGFSQQNVQSLLGMATDSNIAGFLLLQIINKPNLQREALSNLNTEICDWVDEAMEQQTVSKAYGNAVKKGLQPSSGKRTMVFSEEQTIDENTPNEQTAQSPKTKETDNLPNKPQAKTKKV